MNEANGMYREPKAPGKNAPRHLRIIPPEVSNGVRNFPSPASRVMRQAWRNALARKAAAA
jgi:hypothetical protein